MQKAIGMVDAGFLRRTVSAALSDDIGPYDLDALAVRIWMNGSASRVDRELLRTYWYDGAWPPESPNSAPQRAEFEKLDSLPGIRLRAGRLVKRPNSWQSAVKRAVRECGVAIDDFKKHFDFRDSVEQKGVDTLMVLDMTRMAQEGVYQTLLLISGDSDLTEAVRSIQDIGREVIVAVPKGFGLAPELRRAADEVVTLDTTQLRKFVIEDRPNPAPST